MPENGSRTRAWLRRAAWALGAYAALCAVSYPAVPWAVRAAFAKVPEHLPGFSAAAREVSFNPLTLRLTVADFAFSHARLGTVASFGELSAALAPGALLRFALGLRELRLVSPKLALTVAADGRTVLDELPRAAETEPAAGPAFVPRLVLSVLDIQDGELDFESRLPSAPQKVGARPISLRLENLSTIPDDGGRIRLEARTDREERLLWDGGLTVRPPRLGGRIELSRGDLTRVSAAAPDLPVRLDAGRLDASADYLLALDGGTLAFTLKGARAAVSEVLWTLQGSTEPPRGPFAYAVGPAELSVTAVALGRPEAKLSFQADAALPSSGSVALGAYLSPAAKTGGAELTLQGLTLAPFSPLAPPPTRLSVDSGALELRAKAAFSPDDVAGTAELALTGLAVSARDGRGALLGLGRLAVEGARASTKDRSLEVAAVRVERPFLRAARGKDGLTIAEAALGLSRSSAPAPAPARAASAAPAPQQGAPWRARLRRLSVAGGRVVVQDEAVSPPFAMTVSDARAEVLGLVNDGRSTATLTAAARVEGAPFTAEGTVRLSTAAAWARARLKADGIQLPVFSPYSGLFVGYKIDQGAFSFDLDHALDGRAIATKNHAVVDKMELGDKVESPDAVKAPVKLGLAVLKDRHGVITVDVPIDGSLDDPEFHIGRMVLKTLMNLLVKAALSPFSALGDLMGGGPDLDRVPFAAGRAEPAPEAADRLAKVAQALADRPAMLVGVRGGAAASDARALGEAALLARLRGGAAGPDALTPAETEKLLKLHRETLGADAADPAAARAALAARLAPGEGELRALALARTEAVKAALAARGVAPERFFSLDPDAAAADPDARLQLDLR